MGEKTIWCKMAELTDCGLSWGITFYSSAPTLATGQVEKKVKRKLLMKFSEENFIRCFQLEIGDIIAKKWS